MRESVTSEYREWFEVEWKRYRATRHHTTSEIDAFRWAFSAGFDLGRGITRDDDESSTHRVF